MYDGIHYDAISELEGCKEVTLFRVDDLEVLVLLPVFSWAELTPCRLRSSPSPLSKHFMTSDSSQTPPTSRLDALCVAKGFRAVTEHRNMRLRQGMETSLRTD